jgi:hypothetical protein
VREEYLRGGRREIRSNEISKDFRRMKVGNMIRTGREKDIA